MNNLYTIIAVYQSVDRPAIIGKALIVIYLRFATIISMTKFK